MTNVPKTLVEAHERSLPNRAFYPSSIRPLNRAVVDAAFYNWLYGRQDRSIDPVEIKNLIETELLQPTTRAAGSVAKQVFEEVMFGRSEGWGDRKSAVLRVTHPRVGRYFFPDNTMQPWINSLFAHGGISDASLKLLGQVASRAERRSHTVFERAVLAALNGGLEPDAKDGAPDVRVSDSEGRPPNETVHRRFAALFTRTIGGRAALAVSPDHAEALLSDVRRLAELFLWIYWFQLHANASVAIRGLRGDSVPEFAMLPLWFGYQGERDMAGRPHVDDGKQLADRMFDGSTALNALTALHTACGWKEAVWFDQLKGKRDGPDVARALRAWLEKYIDLSKVEVTPSSTDSVRVLLPQVHEAIRAHYQPKDDQDKFPLTVGYGVLRQMGQAEECFWFQSLGRNRGAYPIIDKEFVLLIARTLAGAEPKVRLAEIFEELSFVGMNFDDASKRQIRLDLEANGHIRSLSDSGEAVYVQVR